MVKPPLLNTASTFHFLPFVILNLLLLIANVPEYFRIFFFCLLLPLVSRSKLSVFHRPRVSSLCASCNSEFSFHLIFNFTKVLLFFPGSCFCPYFCFTAIIHAGVPFLWWGLSYYSKVTPVARHQMHKLSSFCACGGLTSIAPVPQLIKMLKVAFFSRARVQ